MSTPWHVHPSDRETWLAAVPGGVLVRIVEQVGQGFDARTTALAFVPSATLEAFGVVVEPTTPVVRASVDAFGFIRTTMGDVPMCGCAFLGHKALGYGATDGKLVRCSREALHDGPHSHILYDPNPPSEAEIAAALEEPST